MQVRFIEFQKVCGKKFYKINIPFHNSTNVSYNKSHSSIVHIAWIASAMLKPTHCDYSTLPYFKFHNVQTESDTVQVFITASINVPSVSGKNEIPLNSHFFHVTQNVDD